MPNDPLAPVSAGQPLRITAAAWNAITAAAKDRRQAPRPDQPAGDGWRRGPAEVLAVNSTGAGLAAFKPAAVTGVGGYTLTGASGLAWQRAPLLTLGVPGVTTDYVVVTLEDIPAGGIGRVAVAGPALCDVQVGSTGHPFANPIAGSADKLLSAATGQVRLVYAPSTGSSVRCVLLLGEQSAAAAGATLTTVEAPSGGLSFWTPTPGLYYDVPLMTITATVAGTYLADYCLSGSIGGVVGRQLVARLVVNGTRPPLFGGDATVAVCQVAAVTVPGTAAQCGTLTLAAGDVVKVQAGYFGTAGASPTVYASGVGAGLLRLARVN